MKSVIACVSLFCLLASAAPTWNPLAIFHKRRDVSLGHGSKPYEFCVRHPKHWKCQPVAIEYGFEVTVPVLLNQPEPPVVKYGGLHFRIPQQALSGLLISFFGNFEANQTTSSQTQVIATQTDSTALTGGVSMSNATATANETAIVAITFSSGNASR